MSTSHPPLPPYPTPTPPGVMLCVLMLRHMPWEYDRYAARLPPMEAMRRLWRIEGVEGVKWREATSKVDRLSEPLKDLLDRMLEADEGKRPRLDQVGILGGEVVLGAAAPLRAVDLAQTRC